MENPKEKFKLGKIQKAWIESLRKHPERQMKGILGCKTPNEDTPYKACCLGELLLTKCRIQKKKFPFKGTGSLLDDDYSAVLGTQWESLGLRSADGREKSMMNSLNSLASMNDNGMTWTEIANIVEKNPEQFFTKSV